MTHKMFIKPEILFCIGACQAMFPYGLWFFSGLANEYNYVVSWWPPLIWLIGLLSFICGCKTVGCFRSKIISQPKRTSLGVVEKTFWILVFASFCMFLYSVYLYKGIPIVDYIYESRSVDVINVIQQSSVSGLLGINNALLILLGSTLSIYIGRRIGKKYWALKFWFVGVFLILAHSMAGKRQGVALFGLSFIVASIGMGYHPVDIPLSAIGIRFGRKSKGLLLSILPIIAVASMDYVGKVRVVDRDTSTSLIRYLELPLINFENQTQIAGFGPYKLDLIKCFRQLLPYKMIRGSIYEDLDEVPRLEPTSASGFWESIHWYIGVWGVLILGIVFGCISKYIYYKSLCNDLYLLVYSYLSWVLVGAHTYNHFLNTVFFWLPTTLLVIIVKTSSLIKR